MNNDRDTTREMERSRVERGEIGPDDEEMEEATDEALRSDIGAGE